MTGNTWIGVRKSGVAFHAETGEPIPRTRDRIRKWRESGYDVRVTNAPPKNTRNLAEWWDWAPVELPGVRVLLVGKNTGYRK